MCRLIGCGNTCDEPNPRQKNGPMTRALNSISNFLFEENCIRATVDGDTPWFVAKDIASALGIEWRGSDWLAAEVLPAIRKTGSYIAKKPIHVRKHDRRTSTKIDDAIKLKRNIDRLETVADTIAPKPQNACAMIIDGEPVWVDINKYHGAGRAVVIEHDGRIRIQDVEPEVINFKPFGARTALGQRFKSPFGGTARNSVAVIGMVIGAERPAIQDTAPVQIEHEPVKKIALEPQYRGKRIKFRDKILQLIDETNLSNRQIAQVTGATYQTVTHWRRWRDDRVSA